MVNSIFKFYVAAILLFVIGSSPSYAESQIPQLSVAQDVDKLGRLIRKPKLSILLNARRQDQLNLKKSLYKKNSTKMLLDISRDEVEFKISIKIR
jgi:hypothetical protein